ncbi:hypothetical protein HN592_04460 [Candidatus Woesearchaeota archaeon]|jgi:aspartokinase|nr:hypothetical protein [Candidatus Woesearchaeota archaeon]MBT4368464.1 hypothetical protein [Candidatus Woesearchaeota archaeon]MBT4712953.1 hypothetical protein [Candidatus Woesearchaeota archaeon]MBT6639865.1 hypothetical protein [Candidatus Woesearchaeota archaeon]MBT7134037.1 hypothetical protein [Candidatus Woesearchaeota archaeon]
MVSIAHLVKQWLKERAFIDEYLKEGLINYGALAEKIQPEIEADLGKVKLLTIAMALRRYAETSKKEKVSTPSFKNFELSMKGNLCDVCVYKSPHLFKKLEEIYKLVDYNKGDTLNIIHGNHDVSILINEKFETKLKNILKGEKILHAEENLVALTVKFGESVLYTPGVDFELIKQLVIENVNLIEIVSSMIELSFIINKKDASKGYRALQEFIEK